MSTTQMKSGLFIGVFLFVFALNFSSALLVTNFNASATYSSYAPPNDPFSGSNNLIFTLGDDQHTISSSNTAANVGNVKVEENGAFIWKTGYYRNFSSNAWVSFNFSGEVIKNSAGQNTNWLSGTATATLNIQNSSLRGGSNPILAYSCKKYNDIWKCGCLSNGESGNCKRWMLQLINVSGEVQQTHGGSSCIDNAGCNPGESCVNNNCVVVAPANPGIPVTGCMELNESGKTYVLQNHVATAGSCFNIQADNITFNGSGYSINLDIFPDSSEPAPFPLTSAPDYAFSLNNRKNVTISNVLIKRENFDIVEFLSIVGRVCSNTNDCQSYSSGNYLDGVSCGNAFDFDSNPNNLHCMLGYYPIADIYFHGQNDHIFLKDLAFFTTNQYNISIPYYRVSDLTGGYGSCTDCNFTDIYFNGGGSILGTHSGNVFNWYEINNLVKPYSEGASKFK